MSLLQRMERAQRRAAIAADALVPVAPPGPPVRTPIAPGRETLLRDIRRQIQAEVMAAFRDQSELTGSEAREKVAAFIEGLTAWGNYIVTRDEKQRVLEEVLDDLLGLGPLEPLLQDETISEIMVNGPKQIYVERNGRIERIDAVFVDDEHVLRIIDRIITPMGRRIDDSSPRVDARLPDGSRVNAIIPPLSLVGPVITIRKFSARPFTVADLVRFGTASQEMFDFLQACIEAKLNIFVSGGTGSGKTTTLNVLSSFIPKTERIVTIEDAAELQLRQDHVITLESRPSNLEGEGEITIRDLLRNSLHMRPDRIIVGECRGGEALDMLQAMTTGHDGSLSTGHANSAEDMLRRLETMVLMSSVELPLRAVREQIASAVDLVVHQARLKDGSRRIISITEIYGIEDDEILTQDIFKFQYAGIVDGRIDGQLQSTGVRPTFMDVFHANGIVLPAGEFGIPPADSTMPKPRHLKSRRGGVEAVIIPHAEPLALGRGRTVAAGGMVYVTSVGPIDMATGEVVKGSIFDQTNQAMSNLKDRLHDAGTTLDRIVWATWSLRDPSDWDHFNEEWIRWFPADAPGGQLSVLTALQRRAGFRVSLSVIAEAGAPAQLEAGAMVSAADAQADEAPAPDAPAPEPPAA